MTAESPSQHYLSELTHDTTRPLKHGKWASSSLSSSFTTLHRCTQTQYTQTSAEKDRWNAI